MTIESEDDIQRRYFGKGLQLAAVEPGEIGLDIELTGTANGRDFALQAGGDNLGQDLKVALLTATGTDVFNLAFGFDGIRILTDDMTPAMTAEMLRLAVMKTVAVDSRVKRVLDVTVSDGETEEEHTARRYTVRAEVQTVLGDVLNLTLGEVNTR